MESLLTTEETIQIAERQQAVIEATLALLPYREKMLRLIQMTETPIGQMLKPGIIQAAGMPESIFEHTLGITKLILFFATEFEKLHLAKEREK